MTAPASLNQLLVIGFVRDNPGCTTADYASALRWPTAAAKRLLSALYVHGHLYHSDRTVGNAGWRWYVTREPGR